jgi:kinetochore protein Mis13/DSN1
VYEEERDGFIFSKASPTRRKGANQSSDTVPEAAAAKETRRKKTPALDPPVGEPAPRRRRSARLSGDKAASAPEQPIASKIKKPRHDGPAKADQAVRDGSPQKSPEQLVVEKKQNAMKVISLPFADTPVIKRNKEMRAAQIRHSSGSRRSSSSLRGRRASSLMESGQSNGMNGTYVHDENEIADEYATK